LSSKENINGAVGQRAAPQAQAELDEPRVRQGCVRSDEPDAGVDSRGELGSAGDHGDAGAAVRWCQVDPTEAVAGIGVAVGRGPECLEVPLRPVLALTLSSVTRRSSPEPGETR
jgi:hypothetical protein